MTDHSHDALVIGGGPAGATAALLLARAGWSVALFEKKSFPRRKVCGEYLSATSLPLLDRLGIGAAFRDLAGPPVCRVGLFAGTRVLSADLPRPAGKAEWGRALARERSPAVAIGVGGLRLALDRRGVVGNGAAELPPVGFHSGEAVTHWTA